jgi:hypothetical protein
MKSFQMTLEFDQPIKAHVLQTGFNNDPNMGIQSKVSMNGDTCNINVSSSERNDSLTFQVTSDQHAVLINGRNFARFDAQTIVLTLFSDSGAIATAKANGMATSESGGHDVPANVLLVRGANNTETLKP